jgi:hypothetical protein
MTIAGATVGTKPLKVGTDATVTLKSVDITYSTYGTAGTDLLNGDLEPLGNITANGGKTVTLSAGTTGTAESITVPVGVSLVIDNATLVLTAITGITVENKGSLVINADVAGFAPGAITIKNGASLNIESAVTAAGFIPASLTVESGGTLNINANSTGSNGFKPTAFTLAGTLKFGSSVTSSMIFLPGSLTLGSSAEKPATIDAGSISALPLKPSVAITVNGYAVLKGTGAPELHLATSTALTNSGVLTLLDTGKLVMENNGSTTQSSLAGTGKIVAGKTEISGAWTTTGSSGDGTLIIAALTVDTASITASGSTACTGLSAVDTTAQITQRSGTGNDLAIAADTTISLGGTAGTAKGTITLEKHATDGGKITMANDTTSVITTGLSASVAAGVIKPYPASNTVFTFIDTGISATSTQKGKGTGAEDAAGVLVELAGVTGGTVIAGTVEDAVLNSATEVTASAT